MAHTLNNRMGDPIIALFIARREGQFDEKAVFETDEALSESFQGD
ncbi:MAG: hypothetical protein RBR24_09285 [Candidatus Carbobacillus sp.]|nr:hypothetical protein [Candidatus Carbobacillus sp.]